MVARVKPASMAVVVSAEALGPGSGGRTCPWGMNLAALACRQLSLQTNSSMALPVPVFLAAG